jgi:hypothetical protein
MNRPAVELLPWGAAALVGAGYLVLGAWPGFLVALALGGGWYAASRYEKPSLVTLAFVALSVSSLFGVAVPGLGRWLHAAALMFAIAGYDMDRYVRRTTGYDGDVQELHARHIRRLSLVLGGSYAAVILAVSLDIAIGFWWLVVLVLVVVIGGRALLKRLLR